MSRQGIAIAALVLIGLAPGRATAETPPAESHWEASAGLAAGLVLLHDDALMKPSSGTGLALMTRVGYVGQRGVGLVVDASLWTMSFGPCVADGACVNHRADRFGMLTAAVRWQATQRLYLQGGAGASHTRYSADRGAETWNDDTLITQVAAIVALGHAW
jgi:hypothetical protein